MITVLRKIKRLTKCDKHISSDMSKTRRRLNWHNTVTGFAIGSVWEVLDSASKAANMKFQYWHGDYDSDEGLRAEAMKGILRVIMMIPNFPKVSGSEEQSYELK